MVFSTLKWIKSWYGRKRRNLKKALGILAVKAEVGDPMISASGAGSVSDVQPQQRTQSQSHVQILGPVDENAPVVATTNIPATGNQNGARTVRTPLTPSRRYAPYTSSKTVVPSVYLPSSNDLQLHPSKHVQYQPSTLPRLAELHSNGITAPSSQTAKIEHINDVSRMNQQMVQNHDAPHKSTENPDASPSSFPYPAAYDKKHHHHGYNYSFNQDVTSSSTLLPAFDISANQSPRDITTPVPLRDHHNQLPIPLHGLSPFRAPPINASLAMNVDMPMVMDDSAFVSFTHLVEEKEEGSQFQRSPEVVDVGRNGQPLQYSELPDYLLRFGTSMGTDCGLTFAPARFAHLRGEEEPPSQIQRMVEAAVDVSSPEPQFASLGSDVSATMSYFPATPARIPTQEKPYGNIPENSSPLSLFSTHQFQTNLSLGQSSSPGYHQQPSIRIPTPTPNNSSLAKISDLSSEVRATESDLINLALRSLTTEEDTFTAAVMLVVLSKAGFVWDY
jgi:hypothetical protein